MEMLDNEQLAADAAEYNLSVGRKSTNSDKWMNNEGGIETRRFNAKVLRLMAEKELKEV